MDNAPTPTSEQLTKLEALRTTMRSLRSVAVAFSGGVDSTLLMKVAHDELGDDTVALTAHSASASRRELANAQALCQAEGIRHVLVETHEFDIEGFDHNPPDRCYLCKREILGTLIATAHELGIDALVEGSNVDDGDDYRPGFRAVGELHVASPLLDAGMTKDDIRVLSRHLGLPTWDKPAVPCLNTRFAYGELLTPGRLAMVDDAEEYLASIVGSGQVRVRVQGEAARIEVEADHIALLEQPAVHKAIVERFAQLGFASVSLDPQGYRKGSMNDTL